MFNSASSPALTNCNITANNATGNGGGLYNEAGAAPVIIGCAISNNAAANGGGGFYNDGSTPIITNSTVSNNTASSQGGGILQINGGKLVLTNSIFQNNSAPVGGAVRMLNGDQYITAIGNTFYSNTASGNDGGALSLVMGIGKDTIINNLFINNKASGTGGNGGGDIVQENGTSTQIVNNTFYGDTAASNSGAIRFKSGGTNRYLYNNIFYKSYNGSAPTDMSLKSGTVINGQSNNLYSTTDPQFVNTADFDGADNIFGTADDGLQLKVCSPAINAGSNAAVPTTVITDITGIARSYNSGTVDIGAYESLASATIGNNIAVCQNDNQPNITFNGSGAVASAYTFIYTINGGTQKTVTTATGSSVTVPASTDSSGSFVYALVSMAANGCSLPQGGTATVTVNPSPQGSLIGSMPCNENGPYFVTLHTTSGIGPFSVGIGGQTYSGIISDKAFSFNYPESVQSFTVNLDAVTGANGCSCSSNFTGSSALIDYSKLPQGGITAPSQICADGTGQLTFTAASGIGPFTLNINSTDIYTNVRDGVPFTASINPELNVAGTTRNEHYRLNTITDSNGCFRNLYFNGESTNTTILTLPTAYLVLTTNNTICLGSSSQLNIVGNNASSHTPYTAIINGTVYANTSGIITVNPITTTTYNMTSLTDANGCTETSSIPQPGPTVAVNPLPQGILSGSSVCQGGTGQLTFTSSTGDNSLTLTINGNNYNIVSGVPFNVLSIAQAATLYTVSSANSYNGVSCARTNGFTGATATITVNATAVLASNNESIGFVTITGNTADSLTAQNASCHALAVIKPNGTNPVSGSLTASIWVDASVLHIAQNGYPYVQRHYEINPATNAATATAMVTLNFSQAEFTAFNADPKVGTAALPTATGDAAGKARLRIYQYHGISNDGSGSPSSYTGTKTVIDPDDASIVWKDVPLSRWEVSFPVTGFSGFFVGTNAFNILPVTIVSFTANLNSNKTVALEWKVVEQSGIKNYVVERSVDGRNFSAVGSVATNNLATTDYGYTDASLPIATTLYYRLRIVGVDETVTYSSIVTVRLDSSNPVTIYPNPAKDYVWLQGGNIGLIGTDAYVTDLQGRVISKTRFSQWPLQINTSSFSDGVYLIKLDGNQFLKLVIGK